VGRVDRPLWFRLCPGKEGISKVSVIEFDFEFYTEVPDPEDALRVEAHRRLQALTEGHDDITGASMTLEELTGETTPNRHQASVVVYMRPNNLTAVEKAETAEAALKGALTAVERQVREVRDKLRETWKQP
jgi:ribosome-associated translation inhibitor RaiA